MPHTSVPHDFARHHKRLRQVSPVARASPAQSLRIVGIPLLGRISFSGEALAELDDAAEIAEVKALGTKAGLAPFSDAQSKHFLGLGDAGPVYCKNALAICEALATEFPLAFPRSRFQAELPPNRMTVITLKDDASYRALARRRQAGATVGGHYDLETNRLVVFDFRGTNGGTSGQSRASQSLYPHSRDPSHAVVSIRAPLAATLTCPPASAKGWRLTASSGAEGQGQDRNDESAPGSRR